jgi:hypothetical protein
VFGTEDLTDQKLEGFAAQMRAESDENERTDYDQRIAHGLKQIEEQMRKEL